MTAAKKMPPGKEFAVDEPIEVRLQDAVQSKLVYLGAVSENGTINHQLVNPSGMLLSMDYAASRKSGWYPRKAVNGWQAEMVEWLESGQWTIVEVR